jgi:hypothetical protein
MNARLGEAPFRVTLEGAGRLEDLTVREIAEFLDGLVTLVARSSAVVLRRPQPASGGRYEGPIEEASHIRLASLSSGSVVAELLPAPSTPLPGGLSLDAESLSEQGIDLVIDLAEGRSRQDPELARAFSSFVERHVGRRPGASLRFEDRRPGHRREAVVDARLSEVLLQDVSPGAPAERDVTGRLFEANLETHSAQVRTPSGDRLDVQFEPDLDQDIRRLLGNRAALRGEIAYEAHTRRARAVHIREIITGDQLPLGLEGVDFWTERPVSDLIAEAGAGPVENLGDLQLNGVSEAEWEALYKALGIAQ